MTEQGWLRSRGRSLERLINYVSQNGDERKLRLFSLACCRRVEHAITDGRSRAALAGLVRCIERNLDPGQLIRLNAIAREASNSIEAPLYNDGVLYPDESCLAAFAVQCATDPDVRLTQPDQSSSVASVAFYAFDSS